MAALIGQLGAAFDVMLKTTDLILGIHDRVSFMAYLGMIIDSWYEKHGLTPEDARADLEKLIQANKDVNSALGRIKLEGAEQKEI